MTSAIDAVRAVRQIRTFTDEPVSDEHMQELLEVARWTGSSTNSQPWHFIAVRNPEQLDALSRLRDGIRWAGKAPLAIALVITAESETSGAFDEGRVTERLLIASHLMGLGAGTAWFSTPEQQHAAKILLNIPANLTLRSMVAIGHLDESELSPSSRGGRKPLTELVSYEQMSRKTS